MAVREERAPVAAGTVQADARVGAALGAGVLSAAIFSLPALLPPVVPLAVLAPFPLARERIRGGVASAALATILALGLIGVVSNASQALVFLLFLAIPALVVGDSVARGKGIGRGCGYGLGIVSLAVAILLLASGGEMLGKILTWIDESRSLAQMKTNGIPEETITRLSEQMLAMRQVVSVVFPALCFVSGALIVLANATALRLYLVRTDPKLAKGDEFESIRWPVSLSVPFVLAGAAVAVDPLRSVGWNALVILAFFFVLEGLAVALFYTRRLAAPPLVRALVFALVLVNPWPLQILALAGLFDIFIDFRKWALPPEAGEGH